MSTQKGWPYLYANHDFWKNPFTVCLATLILFFSSQLFGALFVTPFIRYIPGQNFQLLVYIAANTVFLVALIRAAKKLLGFTWRALGFLAPKPKAMLPVLPAFLLYFTISVGFTLLATRFIPGFSVEQAQEIGFSKASPLGEQVAAFLSLVIITPLFEEVIFRGVLFRGLRRKLPFWVAAVIASVLFALAHGQWNVGIDTFALSLILCYLVERSGGIAPAIALHALKNCLAFALLFIVKV